MLAPSSFDYALIRIVPRVDFEEFINAGVVLHCLEQNFLAARIHLDDARLLALWPHIDLPDVRSHLNSFPLLCSGDPAAGPISRLSRRERFHWLTAPRSTIIQVSAVHTGLCDEPASALDKLFNRLFPPPEIAPM